MSCRHVVLHKGCSRCQCVVVPCRNHACQGVIRNPPLQPKSVVGYRTSWRVYADCLFLHIGHLSKLFLAYPLILIQHIIRYAVQPLAIFVEIISKRMRCQVAKIEVTSGSEDASLSEALSGVLSTGTSASLFLFFMTRLCPALLMCRCQACSVTQTV